jgi:hypothetical protein
MYIKRMMEHSASCDLALPEIKDMICIYVTNTKDGNNNLDTFNRIFFETKYAQ